VTVAPTLLCKYRKIFKKNWLESIVSAKNMYSTVRVCFGSRNAKQFSPQKRLPKQPINTTQLHNTITQHNTTQHNTTQHNTTQHNTTQHNTTRFWDSGGWVKNTFFKAFSTLNFRNIPLYLTCSTIPAFGVPFPWIFFGGVTPPPPPPQLRPWKAWHWPGKQWLS
jgi:hypothetical protein